MAAIDIGSGATDRSNYVSNVVIATENPANGTGTITEIQIWMALLEGGSPSTVRVFTVTMAGNVGTVRDWQDIDVNNTTEVQIVAVSLDVVAGDYIGVDLLQAGNAVERDLTGAGYWTTTIATVPFADVTCTFIASRTLSLYGTGIEVATAAYFPGAIPLLRWQKGNALSAPEVASHYQQERHLFGV